MYPHLTARTKIVLLVSTAILFLSGKKTSIEIEQPPIQAIEASPVNDSLAVRQSVLAFTSGFTERNTELIYSSLAVSLMMFNGNYADDPLKWQTHQYLTGEDLHKWVDFMLREAGPFTNKVEIIGGYLRRNSALVVTVETGSNKFRKWENEKVAYLLGKTNDHWGITAFYIRDIANP